MSEVRLCKDCRFIKPDWLFGALTLFIGSNHLEYARCMHPKSLKKPSSSHLIGADNKKQEHYMCVVQRMYDFDCGKNGKWWEPTS